MWGMIGFTPVLEDELDEEENEPMSVDVEVGDIVSVATREKRPVFGSSGNFDDIAELRVLGKAQGDRILYLCLVTDGDAEHVMPTVVVGRNQAHDYNPEKRFIGSDGIIISDLHVRRVVKEQRGRACNKCTDYNEDVRTPRAEPYLCLTCRDNPWR